ncbi:MAG: S8 family serine peptidase [Kineosporiaceae bacterium]
MHRTTRVVEVPLTDSTRHSALRGVLAVALTTAVAVAAGSTPALASTSAANGGSDASAAASPAQTGQLVVKLTPGTDIDRVNRQLGSRTHSALLASRSLYLLDVPLDTVESDPARRDAAWKKQAGKLINSLQRTRTVVYAEINSSADATEGERFHYWPDGGPTCTGADPTSYRTQLAATQLSLDAAHRQATGARAVVAVLDTGVDLHHPELVSRLAPGGYDYVGDDTTPGEAKDAVDQDGDTRVDEGYGHGTFVAGVIALVAPGARILPQRVLDSDGRGSVFTVAEAVYDSVAQGADVINMSFGTADKLESKVVTEAIKAASRASVVVVAAAGNDGSRDKHYPAAVADVLSVGALSADGAGLAPFSARGDWVDLAAPGEDISSTLPCGFGSWSGTSMAAPFVAGAAALDSGVGGESKRDRRGENIRHSARKVTGVQVHDGVVDLRRLLGVK